MRTQQTLEHTDMQAVAINELGMDPLLAILQDAPDARSVSPAKFADVLEVSMSTIATVARVHRNTVRAAPRSEKLQDAMREMIRVLSVATQVTGDYRKAIFWFKNQPLSPFGHRTAMQVVQEGRAQDVIDYVESMSAGFGG